MEEDFKIIHLSDLHFYQGNTRFTSDKHSIPHLKGVQKIIEKESVDMDRLIISGDISHYGDTESLTLAKNWIYDTIPTADNTALSLGVAAENKWKIRVVPGNHDAWNSTSVFGRVVDKRQKSLQNYNTVFNGIEGAYMPLPDGYFYDWVQKGNRAIFFLFLDSSFIGDSEAEKENPELIYFDRIAKGKVSIRQAERVLSVYDKGMAGKLIDPKTGLCIAREIFSKSLKVVVMHHYLFEPHGEKVEPLLHLTETQTVFRNFACADIDILMCGHKHFAEAKSYRYLEHFNHKAKARYMFNYFRRLIGIHSLPLQYTDQDGKKMDKFISSIISLFLAEKPELLTNDQFGLDEKFINNLSKVFIDALENPQGFENELNVFLSSYPGVNGERIFDEAELSEISKRLGTSFSADERMELKRMAVHVKRLVHRLSSRQFLQLMVGSTSKAQENEKKTRSFNMYKVFAKEEGYTIRCEKYDWNPLLSDYNRIPTVSEFHFHDRNRPLH